MKVALRVKTIREKLQLKQQYVAQQLQVGQQQYSNIETKASKMRFSTFQKIAEVLQVDVHFILNDGIPITDDTIATFQKTKVADMVNKSLNSKI